MKSHAAFDILPPSSATRQTDRWRVLKLGARWERCSEARRSAQSAILLGAVYFYGALLLTLRYEIISLRLARIIRAPESWQSHAQSVPGAPCQGRGLRPSENRSSC